MLNTDCRAFGFQGGRNFGNGFGGHRRRYRNGGGGCYAFSSPQEMREWEIKTLKQQAEFLKEAQEDVQRRIREFETTETK
ncbi:MAG: DUF5320 family protein [Desulfobacterales bacterium]|nr:DUF5320 family protein [Desulfobacterales bacterium]